MQLFDKIDSIVEVMGLVVPVASLLAGRVNQHIREVQAAGETVPSWMLNAASILNVASINLDKARQLAVTAKTAKAGGASSRAVALDMVARISAGQEHDAASCACPCHKEG